MRSVTSVLGIDPGCGKTGHALALDGQLVALGVLTPKGATPALRALQAGLALDEWVRAVARRVQRPLGPVVARIEQAPRTARDDVEHGHQAALGWAQGGLAVGMGVALLGEGHSVHFVAVSDWRALMAQDAGRRGLVLPTGPYRGPELVGKPTASGDDLVFRFRCGHTHRVPRDRVLDQGHLVACPSCAGRPLRKRADIATDTAKWRACAFIRSRYPALYAELIEAARGRERTAPKPEHRLAGVSDACEAAAIALTGVG